MCGIRSIYMVLVLCSLQPREADEERRDVTKSKFQVLKERSGSLL